MKMPARGRQSHLHPTERSHPACAVRRPLLSSAAPSLTRRWLGREQGPAASALKAAAVAAVTVAGPRQSPPAVAEGVMDSC